jgi:hypothetical protein
MSSPDPNQRPYQGWVSQNHQQPPAQQSHNRSSQAYAISQPYYAQYETQPTPYIQAHYGSTSPAPVIAELPAPLPPAPRTTTSEQQLKEDELLAHKIQQLEVVEIRKRSSSAVSQHQRPISMAPPSPQSHSPLLHQVSSLSMRPHSESVSSTSTPWSPGSIGQLPNVLNPSLSSSLPEVVIGPRSVSYVGDPSDNLPIPVHLDQQPVIPSPIVLSNSSTISTYLEENRQVPYPPTWKPPPIVATFYAYAGSKIVPGTDWLSQQESFTWRTIRPTEHAYNPSAPSYTFKFTVKGGSFRDPKFSWFMTLPDHSSDPKKKTSKNKQVSWAYDLRLKMNSCMRKSEVLSHGREKAVLTTYVHALNYDSLRFIGPDGRPYMWVSSSQVSSTNGSRYDTIRHALFAATGQIQDPLYGEIVADHTFWDGYIDEHEVHVGVKCDGCQAKPIKGLRWKCKTCHHHDVCEECRQLILAGGFGGSMQQSCVLSLVCLPDEALYIRSPTVDPALVVATLQVLKDWERHTLRDEKRKNIKGFLASEEEARKHDLGVISYWKASDWDKKNTAGDRIGTVVKAKGTVETFGETTSALGNLVDAGSHGGHSGSGGDGGGGGGGGGGGS